MLRVRQTYLWCEFVQFSSAEFKLPESQGQIPGVHETLTGPQLVILRSITEGENVRKHRANILCWPGIQADTCSRYYIQLMPEVRLKHKDKSLQYMYVCLNLMGCSVWLTSCTGTHPG